MYLEGREMKAVFAAFALLLFVLTGVAAWNYNWTLTMQLGALLLFAMFGMCLADIATTKESKSIWQTRKIREWEERQELLLADLGMASVQMKSAAETLDRSRAQIEHLLEHIARSNEILRPGYEGPSPIVTNGHLRAVPTNGRG
jgi:hypothetical protein